MNRQYSSTSGHTIVSSIDLTYACNSEWQVDPSKIAPKDLKHVSFLADEYMADIVSELSDGKKWFMPNLAVANPGDPELSRNKNYCVMQNGRIMVRNGRCYSPLEQCIETCEKDELALILLRLAHQTVLCQAALAGLQNSEKDQSKAV